MDEAQMPRHAIRVVITRGDTEDLLDVGTLPGCALNEEATAGSLATVRCWWAGTGDTIEVAAREDAVIVTRQGEDSQVAEDFVVEELARFPLRGATATFVR